MMAGAEIPARGEGLNAAMSLQGIVICGVGDQQNKLERRRVSVYGALQRVRVRIMPVSLRVGREGKEPTTWAAFEFYVTTTSLWAIKLIGLKYPIPEQQTYNNDIVGTLWLLLCAPATNQGWLCEGI